MAKIPKRCPLLLGASTNIITPNTNMSDVTLKCDRNCAWFDDEWNECAILGISKILGHIYESIGRIIEE